jgi:hypothetical protein
LEVETRVATLAAYQAERDEVRAAMRARRAARAALAATAAAATVDTAAASAQTSSSARQLQFDEAPAVDEDYSFAAGSPVSHVAGGDFWSMSDMTTHLFQSTPDGFEYPPAPDPEQVVEEEDSEEAAEEDVEEAVEDEEDAVQETEAPVGDADGEEHVDGAAEAPVGGGAAEVRAEVRATAEAPVVVAEAPFDWRDDGLVHPPFPGGPRLDFDDIPSWFRAHIAYHIWDGSMVKNLEIIYFLLL